MLVTMATVGGTVPPVAMTIPALNVDGLLPAGKHDATPAEVHAHLVQPFADPSTRQSIYDWWLMHREALQHICPIQEQWLNGSFVTSKEHPGDLDIVTLVEATAFNSLAPALRALTSSLLSGSYTRAFWRCDSYVITVFDPTDPNRPATDTQVAYWENFFGHTRGGDAKGFVRIP